jgi:hypothetical protein
MPSVREVLAGLADGSTSVETAEADFKARVWARTPKVPVTDAGLLDDTRDPEPATEDAFSEVEQAYIDGRIDRATYARLGVAAATAMKAESTLAT